jgi:hypothetical protein
MRGPLFGYFIGGSRLSGLSGFDRRHLHKWFADPTRKGQLVRHESAK